METFTLVKHRVGDAFRNTAAAVVGTSSESKFIQHGTLTPQEFQEAGDQLVYKFPTWQWSSCEPSLRHSCLPPEKQFLITRNVPCTRRVRALEVDITHNATLEDGWLVAEAAHHDELERGNEVLLDYDAQDITGHKGDEDAGGLNGFNVQEDFIGGGLPDFSDVDAVLAEIDPSVRNADGGYMVGNATDMDILRTRTYDLSITYDKWYQTPRLWLFGYDEYGEPLTQEQVYEDIQSDYISKTVTFDPHPHTGTPTVSIHPCQHAQVMKRVVDDWLEQGWEPRHDLALFVFLKFISSVVPTINYDFTMDIEF